MHGLCHARSRFAIVADKIEITDLIWLLEHAQSADPIGPSRFSTLISAESAGLDKGGMPNK
jgi:hypothetical protein